MKNALRAALAVSTFATLMVSGLVGCASTPKAATPAAAVGGSRVVVLFDEDIMLTGTTDPRDAASTCGPAASRHVVKLNDSTKSRLTLRATQGAAPLEGAILRVTHLDTKKTWCASLTGSTAMLAPGEPMPSGLYAVQVSTPNGEERRYEILWEQL
jgi:hypothetical protein